MKSRFYLLKALFRNFSLSVNSNVFRNNFFRDNNIEACTIFFALPLACTVFLGGQLALAQKPTTQRSTPALVTPPDLLIDETGEVEDSIQNENPLPETPPSSGQELSEEEPVQTQIKDPPPQIKRKKVPIDPRFRPENRYIEHPNAEKGLIRIDKDRVYHYKVKTSPKDTVGTFKIGVYEPSDLANPDDPNLTFDELYTDSSFPILLYDHEKIFSKKIGQLNWKVGGGFYFAQGNGKFGSNDTLRDPAETPQEKFSLMVFPLNAGLSYKFKYWPYQWIVPYAEGGIDAFCFAEIRDDDNNPGIGARLGIAPAAHFSLGGSIALGKNARSFLDLDREYGINAIYFTAEYRNYIALSDKFDFSGDVISGGISAEY